MSPPTPPSDPLQIEEAKPRRWIRFQSATRVRITAALTTAARLPEGDMGGAVFGRAIELDEAPAQPVRPCLQQGEEARRLREGQDG